MRSRLDNSDGMDDDDDSNNRSGRSHARTTSITEGLLRTATGIVTARLSYGNLIRHMVNTIEDSKEA